MKCEVVVAQIVEHQPSSLQGCGFESHWVQDLITQNSSSVRTVLIFHLLKCNHYFESVFEQDNERANFRLSRLCSEFIQLEM